MKVTISEKRIAKLWKKGKICMKITDKGGINCLKVTKVVIGWFKPQLWMWLVDLTNNFNVNGHNFEWLIDLNYNFDVNGLFPH